VSYREKKLEKFEEILEGTEEGQKYYLVSLLYHALRDEKISEDQFKPFQENSAFFQEDSFFFFSFKIKQH